MESLAFNFARDVVDPLATEGRTGLVFVDEFGHRRDYTFEEISLQSQRYAAVLRAFGVIPGERVVLRGTNNAKFIFTVLALERLGALATPCAQTCTAVEFVRDICESNAATIVANRKYRAQIDEVRGELSGVERFIIVGEEAEGWARLDSLVDRAQPYAGLDDERASYQGALPAGERLSLAPTDRFWSTLPVGSAGWIANTLIGAWSCGAATVVHEGVFDPVERFELLRELEVSVLLQTAGEYEALGAVLENIGKVRLPRLRRAFCAAGDPGAETAQRWLDEIQVPIERVPSGVQSLQKS